MAFEFFSLSATIGFAQLQPPAQAGAIGLFAAAVAWSSLWVQLAVLPFFNKAEALYKDYWASGRINSALAVIEADQLITALARMFDRVMEARPDRRRRLEGDFAELLQSTEFLPDLKLAHKAISDMEEIESSYRSLIVQASRIWKWGLGHAILTPFLPGIYIFIMPTEPRAKWALVGIAFCWILTLLICTVSIFRIHSRLTQFNSALEVDGGVST